MCGSTAILIESARSNAAESKTASSKYQPQTEMAPMESWIPEEPFTWAS